MDANITDAILAYDQYGCAQISVNIAKNDGIVRMIESYVEQGLIFKADTIEELAEKLGIPADNLKATVERYNELCAKGVDEDFGKEAYRMRPVAAAPVLWLLPGRQSADHLRWPADQPQVSGL